MKIGNSQKRTARCWAVLVRVSRLLAVTSSIMSSSSLPVFLFCTSHSRTSSSRIRSPVVYRNYKPNECLVVRLCWTSQVVVSFFFFLASLFTFKNDRDAVAVVDQSGQRAQTVFFGQFLVCDFNESDSKLIGLVVNVFQFTKNFFTFFVLWTIWRSLKATKKDGIKINLTKKK